MNATSRTLIFVGVAAVSAAAAMGVRYANQPAAVDGFTDVGQPFFTDFQDPLRASELSVQTYDADAKDPLTFSVKQDDKGLWVIPSHHNYPAEAAQRLARTATSLLGISKIAIQSRSKEDWARYGVEDPGTASAIDVDPEGGDKDESRGTRITLRDSSGNSLVDLIVGKPVPGREKHFYVRQPDKNPVFITKIDSDLSAKFSDWIEPDLLKLNQNDIVQIIADRYSVDEEQGAILQGEKLEFSKDKTAGKWSMAGVDPLTESLKETAITDVTRNLDQLKIVGVRPKPAGLNPDLTVTREVAQNPLLRQMLQGDMQRQGFYIARGENDQVKLVSNEGELIAGTSNGVRYTLYFGEIARGTAKDIEIGLKEAKPAEGDANAEGAKAEGNDSASPEAPATEDKPDDSGSGPRRYLLVKVDYDESLLGPKPTEPVAPEKPAILNEGDAPAEDKPADAPSEADAPKEADATKEEAPKSEEKAKEPNADAATPETPAEPKSEPPVDPGSCDEPPAAEPADGESAKEASAQENPAATTESPAQESAAPAAADEAVPPKENPAPAEGTPPAAPQTDPAAPAATTPEPAPPTEAELKAEAQKAYDQAMGEYEAAKAGYQSGLKTWEEQAKEGQKKVSELSTRFGSWYYVISADSFEKFAVTRATVVEPKKESDSDSPAPPGAGSIPDFNLPDLGK